MNPYKERISIFFPFICLSIHQFTHPSSHWTIIYPSTNPPSHHLLLHPPTIHLSTYSMYTHIPFIHQFTHSPHTPTDLLHSFTHSFNHSLICLSIHPSLTLPPYLSTHPSNALLSNKIELFHVFSGEHRIPLLCTSISLPKVSLSMQLPGRMTPRRRGTSDGCVGGSRQVSWMRQQWAYQLKDKWS